MTENKVTAFEIDRRTWLRGEGYEASRLLRSSDGKMCCLGSYSLACGLPSSAITDIDTPARGATMPEMSWLIELQNDNIDRFGITSLAGLALMKSNDDEYMDDALREEFIRTSFAKQGITVTFTN